MKFIEVLQLIVDNWYLIFTAACIIILAVHRIIEFIGYPTKKKIEEIKNRLLAYVTDAELALGSGTGKLKLAQVYDYFCTVFPYTKKWFTLDSFEKLVDEVLPTMREILEKDTEEDILK